MQWPNTPREQQVRAPVSLRSRVGAPVQVSLVVRDASFAADAPFHCLDERFRSFDGDAGFG